MPSNAPAVPETAIPIPEAKISIERNLLLNGQHTREPHKVSKKVTVEFDFGSSVVRPIYTSQLQKLAALIKSSDNPTVVIEGHTDNVGRKGYNYTLSLRRAESVKKLLVKAGVDARRITIKGYGYMRPTAENSTDEGRQKNRRATAVVIVLTTAQDGVESPQ